MLLVSSYDLLPSASWFVQFLMLGSRWFVHLPVGEVWFSGSVCGDIHFIPFAGFVSMAAGSAMALPCLGQCISAGGPNFLWGLLAAFPVPGDHSGGLIGLSQCGLVTPFVRFLWSVLTPHICRHGVQRLWSNVLSPHSTLVSQSRFPAELPSSLVGHQLGRLALVVHYASHLCG